MNKLSPPELSRYARHLQLPNFSSVEQLKLKSARVLIIGAGGLGAPVLLYLAAAGIGTIGIIDPDRINMSNLQRQVLYTEKDLGKLKVEVAKKRLLALNPLIKIQVYPTYFTKENALALLSQYSLVVDGTDNFPTRYLVNDACVLSSIPYVYGSIFRYEGQVSVFNAIRKDGSRGPNYRDLFPTPPPPGQIPNCAEGGVLGVLAGIIGSLQASEAIKLITGIGQLLDGRLYIFDSANFSSHTIKFNVNPATKIKALIDYEVFCGMPSMEGLPAIDAATFIEWQKTEKAFSLLDVRQVFEHEMDQLGGILIPLDQLKDNITEVPQQEPLVIYCRTGSRSAEAVEYLLSQGFKQVYNLEGGIEAVRKQETD